jgi:glycosyltransferase involved in cell wall biosynthesis
MPEAPPPRVSVICPVYNTAPDLLEAAARSVLEEASGRVCELILVDDGSDRRDTRDAMQRLADGDGRVRLLRSGGNRGPSSARNLGIAAAAGDWIGFTDADDLWRPNRLACLTEILSVAPDAGWVCGNVTTLAQGGRLSTSEHFASRHCGARILPNVTRHEGPDLTRLLIGNYWLHLGACIVRKSLAESFGGFAQGCFYSEDWLFFIKASLQAPLYYVQADCYALRRERDSLTTSSRRLTRQRVACKEAALRDRSLAAFRRELRWALWSTYKGLAANNLLVGNRLRAMRFALRAYCMDPREIGAAMLFARMAMMRDRGGLRRVAAQYSAAELFIGAADRQQGSGPAR